MCFLFQDLSIATCIGICDKNSGDHSSISHRMQSPSTPMDEGHCSQGVHRWVWSHTPKDPKSNAQNYHKAMAALKEREVSTRQDAMAATDYWWQTRQCANNIHKTPLSPHKSPGGGGRESRITPTLQLSKLHSESLSDVPTLSQAANGPASKDHAGLRTPTIAKSETILPNTLPPSSTWRIFTVYSTGARVHHARNKVGQGIHELSTQNQRRWIDWIKPLLPVNTNPSCLQPSVFQTETWNYLC